MKTKDKNANLSARQTVDERTNKPEGYPLYPATDDIYHKYHEEKNLDPDSISRIENSANNEEFIISEENDFNIGIINENPDISGLELNDIHEDVGFEDEENNYYSLGGDDHNDLEED